jgi:hypothetical protein
MELTIRLKTHLAFPDMSACVAGIVSSTEEKRPNSMVGIVTLKLPSLLPSLLPSVVTWVNLCVLYFNGNDFRSMLINWPQPILSRWNLANKATPTVICNVHVTSM